MKYIIMFCFVVNTHIVFSQTAYYDAKALEIYLGKVSGTFGGIKNDPSGYIKILRHYIENDPTITDCEVVEIFKKNPFLKAYFVSGNSSGLLPPNSGKSLNLVSTMGDFPVTTFADGMAKFLVERAKEELNIAFFEKLKKLSEKYPECKILFPNTQNLLTNFDSWAYANIINTLRESFDKDLQGLLFNITQLSKLDSTSCGDDRVCKERLSKLKELFSRNEGRIFLSAVLLGNWVISDQKLPDVINEMAGVNYLGGLTNLPADVNSSIQLLNIVSFSLRSKDADRSYVSSAEFDDLMNDTTTKYIYFGLLYQQIKNKNIVFTALKNANENKEPFIKGIKTYIEPVLFQANDLKAAYDKLSEAKKKGEQDLSQYRAAIFESGKSLLLAAEDTHKIDPSLTFSPTVHQVFEYSKSTLAIAHDISVRNYSAAIVGTLTFMMERLPSDKTKKYTKVFVKYTSFAANVVQAKSSDEVKDAIKAIALPAGSASIKKHTRFNVALNAYLGGFKGEEFLSASPGKKWAPLAGVYAPIGITVSTGFGKYGSLSGFGSIIDIGSFASFRLQDTTTKTLPEVTFQNILAPGGGLIYGIPYVPLSIGCTWQYGPMLREIKDTGINASDKPNHRWQIFLAVDIPIVNFFSSPAKSKN